MVMLMKNENIKGVIQLVISIAIYYLLEHYFYDVISLVGIKGDLANFIVSLRYPIRCLLIFLIYRDNIHSSKNKYNKSLIMSVIFSLGTFVVLALADYLLVKVISTFHSVEYGFTNYFGNAFDWNDVYPIAIDLVFIPFIVTVIYVLGVSNIIKNKTTASVVSGILYGAIHIMNYNCSLECSFFIVLIPSIIIMLLTYLYKTTNNIWMVFISYILFKGLGYQILRYLP